MSAHRQYELVYLLPGDATEQDVADIHTHVHGIVSRFEGVVEKTENWGRRRLAYEVGRQKEAVYVLHVFTGPADLIKELDRRLKVSDKVLRHLVVRIDEEARVAERRRTARQAALAQRRAKRGLPPETEETPAAAPVPAQDAAEATAARAEG
jgi:small subunit ribosomal protein S6